MHKKLYIKTYGCQMNVYDSHRMADVLQPLGYRLAETVDDADMVVLNTCHIREKAAEKIYSDLGRIRSHKERKQAQGASMLIAVAGCVAQAEGEEIFARAPFVDIVVGPQTYHHLPELVTKALERQGTVMDLEFPLVPKFDLLPEFSSPQGVSAFLSVQEGCDKFCTFCVVPYTRGAEYSRPVAEVYREALKIVAAGAKEITLLGQNVNAYHGEAPDGEIWSLAKLIRHLAKIRGLHRIRYTTSHPKDMTPDLIEAHADVEKLMPFLHLPVQSGSNTILKAMNRKHGTEEYLKIVASLRRVRPDIGLSSDFIAGFPGETETDFEETLQLVREVGYAQAYSFKYSPRPGTPAAEYETQVPEEVKSKRLLQLQALLNEQQIVFNQKAVGSVVEVLLDREGKYSGQLLGRTPYMQSVHIDQAGAHFGELVSAHIVEARPNSLSGKLMEERRYAVV